MQNNLATSSSKPSTMSQTSFTGAKIWHTYAFPQRRVNQIQDEYEEQKLSKPIKD